MLVNVFFKNQVDQTEATHEKTDEIQQTTELNTADIIHQHFDITTNLANEMNCPRYHSVPLSLLLVSSRIMP